MQSTGNAKVAAACGMSDGAARLRRIVRELLAQELEPGQSTEHALEALVERWNTVIDPVARRDLVTDVKSLVADYVRPVRRSLVSMPPSKARIYAMAEQLSRSAVLARIQKKDPLTRYVRLCILMQLAML